MKSIREKISFKVYKKGRKWIQCFISYETNGVKKSVQAKVLITEELKNKKEGEWVNNLPAEIHFSENSFTGKEEVEAYPIKIDNSSYVFDFGKHKFSNINKVAEKDFFYIVYLASLDNLDPVVKSVVDFFMMDYKVEYISRELEYWKGEEVSKFKTYEYSEIEGYKFIDQKVRQIFDEDYIEITNLYKKI